MSLCLCHSPLPPLPPAPRVMKVGGRYMCVSLAQDHVLECLMDNFKEGWLVRVHVVAIEISEEAGLGGELPVFVFVMTKMAAIPGQPAVKVGECGCIVWSVSLLCILRTFIGRVGR